MKIVGFVVSLALLAVPVGGALAQPAGSDFPNRPLRYIVPFPPGGSTDIVARIVAEAMTERLGQQVVIDNRGGGGRNPRRADRSPGDTGRVHALCL